MPRKAVRYRVRASGPRARLELDAGKLARPVLSGRDGSNAVPLPDQTLETKARFINQVMSGKSGIRQADDIGNQELSFAEAKAIVSGNPAVLPLAESDAELQRLTVLKKNHADEQYLARRSLKTLPTNIASLRERLAGFKADRDTVAEHAGDPLILGGRAIDRDDAIIELSDRLDTLPVHVSQTRRFPLGEYRGLRFGVTIHPIGGAEVYLEGAATRDALLSREHHGPRAVLNALQKLANGYDSECERVRQDLAIAESQLRDYQARLGKPFPHENYLGELTELRDQLKAKLSAADHGSDDERGPAASELANKIKVLKAANTIEAAPQRARQKRSSAEEPVTARIRRRHTEVSESPGAENLLPHEATPANDNHHAANDNRPSLSFAERITLERQRQDHGPGLP